MKVIIIGGVAAGMAAAMQIRRDDENAEIVVYDKDRYISYSSCAMPYYIGKEIENPEILYPRNAGYFFKKYNIIVHILHEVIKINSEKKELKILDSNSNELVDNYDKLIIATGSNIVKPKIEGISKAFFLHNINDMQKIQEYINNNNIKNIVIIGVGYIGLELCDAFSKQKINIKLISRSKYFPKSLDEDMGIKIIDYIDNYEGIDVLLNTAVSKISEESIICEGKKIITDMVIVATGIIPNTGLAKTAKVKIGINQGIIVNSKMETNIKDIYACGDCTEHINVINKEVVYAPLGSTARKMGKIAGINIVNNKKEFKGVLKTSIFRFLDLGVAKTGLLETEAISYGYDIISITKEFYNRPKYMNGKKIIIKSIADKKTRRILGAQVIGVEGVDKVIDVFATIINFEGKIEDLMAIDFAYSPPYSTPINPIGYMGLLLEKELLNKKKPQSGLN